MIFRLLLKLALLCLALALLMIGIAPAAQAQRGDAFLLPGDLSLVLLRDQDLNPLLLRVNPAENSRIYFLLYGSEGVQPQARLLDLEGNSHPIQRSATEDGGLILEADIGAGAGGEYFLELRPAPNSRAGYLRLEYLLDPPIISPVAETRTILQDPLEITFEEDFNDNARAWWVGRTLNTASTLVGGGLTMVLNGAGQTLSGFSSVSGSEASHYEVRATVRIDGDTNDSSLGLALRMIDGVNFYLFQIAPEAGLWRFALVDEARWETRFGWHYDPRLLNVSGQHEIGVWVLGDLYIPLWNNEPLGHLYDASRRIGGVGFFAEVAPDGIGSPRITWQHLQYATAPLGSAWPSPQLPSFAQVRSDGVVLFAEDGQTRELESLLIGHWFWEGEAQIMYITFASDGNYEQRITPKRIGNPETQQTGRWFVERNTTLILELADLPAQRYNPRISDSNLGLIIPELGNRAFIRIPEDNLDEEISETSAEVLEESTAESSE